MLLLVIIFHKIETLIKLSDPLVIRLSELVGQPLDANFKKNALSIPEWHKTITVFMFNLVYTTSSSRQAISLWTRFFHPKGGMGASKELRGSKVKSLNLTKFTNIWWGAKVWHKRSSRTIPLLSTGGQFKVKVLGKKIAYQGGFYNELWKGPKNVSDGTQRQTDRMRDIASDILTWPWVRLSEYEILHTNKTCCNNQYWEFEGMVRA